MLRDFLSSVQARLARAPQSVLPIIPNPHDPKIQGVNRQGKDEKFLNMDFQVTAPTSSRVDDGYPRTQRHSGTAKDQGCNSIDIYLGPVSGPEPCPSHFWSFEIYLNFHWAQNWATKLCQLNRCRPKQPKFLSESHVLGRVLGTKLGQAQNVN